MLLVLSRRNSYLKDIVVFIPHLTSECSLNDQFSEEQLLADVMRRARSWTETCMSSFLLKFLVIFEDRVDHVFAFRTWSHMACSSSGRCSSAGGGGISSTTWGPEPGPISSPWKAETRAGLPSCLAGYPLRTELSTRTRVAPLPFAAVVRPSVCPC